MSAYKRGLEVLGDGVGDFLPFLNIVGKVAGGAGGLTGGGSPAGGAAKSEPSKADVEAAVQKAIEQDRAKQARAKEVAKAEASAKTTQLLLVSILGVLGLGGAYLLIRKK